MGILWLFASVLGGQGIARGKSILLQANATSEDFAGYGLWAIWGEPADGGVCIFTFQYTANSVTIISDAANHHDRLWRINKSSIGEAFSITNLQNAMTSMWVMNLTPRY